MKVIEVSDVLFTPKELPFKIKFGAMSQEKLVRKCPLCVCVCVLLLSVIIILLHYNYSYVDLIFFFCSFRFFIFRNSRYFTTLLLRGAW